MADVVDLSRSKTEAVVQLWTQTIALLVLAALVAAFGVLASLQVQAQSLSSTATLSSLTVSPRDISFEPARTYYAVGVASTVASATIEAIPTHSGAGVSYSVPDADGNAAGHQVDLDSGANTVTVTVTAEDNTSTQDYTLVIARGSSAPYGWAAEQDLDGLLAAGQINPYGIWSNDRTLWISDFGEDKLFAYNKDGTRATGLDYSLTTLNDTPTGIWSDDQIMWVADADDNKLYAYEFFEERGYQPARDISLDVTNTLPGDIWSDGETMWVLDVQVRKLFAYQLSGGERDEDKDYDFSESTVAPSGIWSDRAFWYVADSTSSEVSAYDIILGERNEAFGFTIPADTGLMAKASLWSDGVTVWVVSPTQDKVFAFNANSQDATLSTITVNTGEFVPGEVVDVIAGRTLYAVGVDRMVTTVTIDATPTFEKATPDYRVTDSDPLTDGIQVLLSTGRTRVNIVVTAYDSLNSEIYTLDIGRGSEAGYGWRAQDDLNGLIAAGNEDPFGIWANDDHIWIVDTEDTRLYVYNKDGTLDSSQGFALHSDNSSPTGIWSDGVTIWVADTDGARLFAYTLSNGERDSSEDIVLDDSNKDPAEIWADGQFMWVLDSTASWLYVYQRSNGERVESQERGVSTDDDPPTGFWMDDETIWIADKAVDSLVGWDIDDRIRNEQRDFPIPDDIGITDQRAVWSDSITLWVVSDGNDKVYAFNSVRHQPRLSALTVAPRDILGFTRRTTHYAVGVNRKVTTATITAIPIDSSATLAYSVLDLDPFEDGHQVDLSIGLNTVAVTVTAHDGYTTMEHTIDIGRSHLSRHSWRAEYDLNGLRAVDNIRPVGLWGNDDTIWVTDSGSGTVFAYNRYGTRDASKEFPLDTDNSAPEGIWSNGVTVWVADSSAVRLFGYQLSDGTRDSAKDIKLDPDNTNPSDVWSDGVTIWVANQDPMSNIFAYQLSNGTRTQSSELNVRSVLTRPSGIWSDGVTLWVTNPSLTSLAAWNLETLDREAANDITLPAGIGLTDKRAFWSNGNTLWVLSNAQNKAYALNLTSAETWLSSLSVSPRDIIGFHSERNDYAVGMANSVTTATVGATATDGEASLSYNSSDADPDVEGHQVDLSVGLNTFTITVTAPDGVETDEYSVGIGRGDRSQYGWRAEYDLDGLIGAENQAPFGMWGNRNSIFVVDSEDVKVYVYQPSDGTRRRTREFPLDPDNAVPTGIWSDGTTIWVANWEGFDTKLYAYRFSGRTRDSSKDITLDTQNEAPADIWSNGTTIWVADIQDGVLYAYGLENGIRDSSKDLDLSSDFILSSGIWSDETTMWVADAFGSTISAYDLTTRTPAQDRDFLLPSYPVFAEIQSIWSDGLTMWVLTSDADKAYSFNLISDDPTLSSLRVSPRDIIGFEPDRENYAVGMASTVERATVIATPSQSVSTVSYSVPDADMKAPGHQVDLSAGLNTLTVTITAQDTVSTQQHTLTIGRGVTDVYGWKAVDDLDGLISVGNQMPYGIWGNENNIWVVDADDLEVYAYNLDGTPDASKDFPLDTQNSTPGGIWSNGVTVWVSNMEFTDRRLYAYRLSDGAREALRDIPLHSSNPSPADIWSDGVNIWVLDVLSRLIHPYRLSDGVHQTSGILNASAGTLMAGGIWSDGTSMWVIHEGSSTLPAWNITSGEREEHRDIVLPTDVGFTDRKGIWSMGRTLWATSANEEKVYSFNTASDDASLSSLTVSPRDIFGFTPDTTAYAVGMGSTVTRATVTATTNQYGATVSYSVPDADMAALGHQVDLSPGPNYVTVTVTAQDTTTAQEYILTIVRGTAIVLSVSSLTVLEGDATGGAYTVALATEPSETVTVTVSGQQNTDVTLGGLTASTLTFSDTDWGSPQSVTVTARDDADDTDDSVTLTHTAAGGEYTGVSADLAVTVTDDDRGIVLSVSSLTVLEGDATGGTYTVKLATEPSETVTVTVSGQQNTDVTLGASTLTFSDTDWASPQSVTVTARDDADGTDDSVTLTHTAAGGEYTGVSADLAVTVTDDDRGIVLSVSSLTVLEGDATGGTYTVALATEPSETVTVTVSGQQNTDVTLGASTLTFSDTDWASPQSVTVTARDDADGTDDSVTLTHTAAGGEYTGVSADLAVTVTDDDRGIVLSVSSLTVLEGDATGGTYTVKLATEPTETVTVTVSGQQNTDVTLGASTLTFSDTDWASPQSVTVTARDDADGTDDSVTLTHTAAGGEYTGVSADLAVTVTDDDRGIVLSVSSLTVLEGDATGGTYTVALATEPSETVTVTVSGQQNTDVTLGASTLTFSDTDWASPQSVTVTARDDADGTDDSVTLTHTAAGGEYTGVTADLAVTVTDDDRGIVLSVSSLTVLEGDATGGAYTVALATEPSETVTVTVSGQQNTDVTLGASTLTFSDTDWASPQSVTVTARDDADGTDDSVTLTHTAAGGEYTGVSADLAVTVTDDDRGIVLSVSSLTVLEGDATGGTYTVALATEPSETVTVTVSGQQNTDVTLGASTLTFSDTDWASPQSVTVTARDDADGTDDSVTLTHTAAGGEYTGVSADLAVTVTDDDRGIVLSVSSLTVLEGDATGGTYTVALATEPSETVTVTVSGQQNTDVTLGASTLTFSDTDWASPQSVTVTARDDADGTDDSVTLTHTAAGGEYTGVSADLAVTVTDDDRGIVLSVSSLTVLEGDATGGTYTVALATEPSETVTVTVSGQQNTDVTLGASTLTFSDTDWASPQSVTVTARDDADGTDDSVTLTHTAAGGEYTGVSADLAVTVTDDDRGIVLSVSSLTVLEGDATGGTYTVALATEPSETVTVTVSGQQNTDVTLGASTLTFSDTDWASPQSVTVTARDDADGTDDSVTLTHTAAGGEYTGVSADLAVTVTDDDRGIVLSVSSLTVLEGDATGGTYTVKLATEPTETVTVTVSGQQNTDVTLGASTLTFSDTDWASPQSVTVTARDDADDTDDSVTLTHTAAGGEYTGVTADLAVTVTDDDRGIVLSVSSLTVLEGDATGGTYTVALATEPTETVTVTVSGQQNTDVTLGASTLTFSDTDWASPQSVTVTARDDADDTDDSVTLTHTAAGGEYTGVSADLAVTVTDDDRGIVLSVSSLTVLEGDATGGTYTVALATEPSETVTVTVSGQQNTDVTLGASTLTFSDTDWASPQSVTVTARDDADDTDDSVTLTHTAAGGEYTGVTADLAVTVTDDDRGIVLSVSSLTVLEGDATGGTYTVKLATEPTETVTVTVSGQQNTDVTLGASTLTFSDTDWASPQSVTVTARDDADDTDDSVTLTHTAAGGEYTGVTADLAVTVTDDDRGIVLSVSSLTVLEGDATGGTYTVKLATEPTETVTVTVSGQQNTDVTLGASTLTFSDTDWASPQSVTVTARDDADDTDDSVTLTHTAAGGEYTGVTADLAVTVTDDDRGIVLSVSSLTVLEGDATGGTYTVKLATEPTETVTVTVSGQQNTDVTLGASTLTFSDTDWASPQSVTVTARDDADDTDDSVTLTHTAAGGEYTGVTADLAVTVTDDDRGIVLSVSSLTVLEGDATGGTYTVKLATEPTETVTVTVSGQQNTDVTLGASTLTFSDTDWASPQSVTVTARDDADDTDDSVTLTHTAAGGEYTGVTADLAVTVTDDDRGIVLSVSSLTVLEGDATGGTYTVKLATEPTETVTVTVSGQQNTDVTLGASTLTFSDTDWASPQSVTVTARDDADDTDDSVTLTHTAAGGEYTGVSADLAVTVTDDDRGIVLSVSSLTVLEGDATGGTYTVALATEPTETVTVTVSGQQNTDVTLGASTLTFSDTDWASPQSVTVTARDDADDTDDSVTLTHTAAGGEYTGVSADLAVTVTDDDRGIVLSVSSLTVLEGDATGGTYTVKLATEPTETVTVTVSGQQNTDVTLGASTLTFSDTDWASPQSVTVTARDDADDTDDSVTLTHTAAGGEYTGVSADLAVTVTDDDRGIVLSVSSLTVLEGDATGGTYTVALATEPTETVTVTVSGQQNTDVTLGASTLTFSDTDWASPQSVTVTARDDADGTDDSVTLTHTAAGGEYTGVSADLAVTVTDDDRGIVLSVSSLTVLEGDATGGTYTVKLATEPTETVTVTVSGQQNTDVTLGASTLTFSDTDWASPQSVTVTARDDADDTDDSVTLTHTAAGGEYTGVSADLAVTVTDDDRGIVLSVSSLTVLEGDATGGTYTVKLATEPTETVTVTVSGQQNTDVTLGASTLTFSDTDWASPQSVTVTARDDADDTDDSVTLTHTAAGGEYTGVSADLAVTVTDDDRGIVLSVSSLTVLEGDATGGTYTVKLATEPTETVTVTVSGQQNTDVTLGASTLTFSDTDWASPQSVTVTARDDADGTDDSVTLTHTAAGGEYTGVSADLAVTVTDDDRGIVLSVSSLTVLEGDATGGAYTVALATEPSETVTVTVSGQQNTDVTLGASTLTFSDTDWASPQSVTVTARDDADGTDDSVTLTHTAAGGEYTGVSADLAVTVTDDDRGIVLSVSSLTVLEGDATGGTYTVALATEPSETVTVTVSGQQNTDVTLGASTLTFSDTDWASPQSVTVTARDDADGTDDSVTLTHTAAGGEYTGVSADLAVTVTDDDRGIVLSVSSLTVLEGDATGGTYTVALATEPTETVTVTVSGQQNTDVTLGASTLTFSDTDWASPQSVTVTARDDADGTDDSVTLTHTAAGGEYTGVSADLAVTVTDDDRGIVLSVSSLTVLEGDATGGAYTVKLATEPTETVTVTVSGQQNTDVTLGASTLTFSDTDWASPQSVTVTARDDADDTDDSVTLTHTAAGGEYTGVSADLAVTVTDDDRGIVLSVSSLTVLEGDATGGTYTVKLATEPSETVTVTVSGQQNTDVTLGASTLTFSDTDWASPQSVTVTARDDADGTDDSVTLTHTAAGGEYTGVSADLAVTVTDDDRGIVLSVSSLTVLEGDATGGTYTVKLATEPTETVTVTVSGQQNTDVTLGASTLTFSDTDWASPQSVTVTARDDADDTDDSVTLTHTAAGGEYTGVSADLAVTVTDDDRGIVLSVSSLTVLEGDATGGTYTVKLATEPSETVTVTVSGQQNTDVTLGASTLTFSDTDWASPQSVTVTARDDADGTDDSVTLTHTAAGGEYTGVTADLAVTVTDDDRGIVLSVSSLTVLEGDATGGTYTVKLATEPTETVTVTVSGQQNTDVTLGASTLTFSDTDWASPQSVTVTARDDADGTDDSVTLTHTAAGGEYTGVSADLAVTVTDDDRGIVLSVSSLTVLEGDATGGTYTVKLATEPTETVTVTVSGQQNTDVTLGASTLTFSDTDWASPQSVTVTARDDADDTDDSVTLTHTAAGGEYTGVTADLAVTVTDDDRGIVLSVSSLTVLEGDATGGTYTVKLATEPTETVTVTVSGQQNTDVTLGASTLTFSDTDWASPQSVTVTARDDADGTDDSVTLTHTAAGGEYTGVSADLAVTVTDDDRGIVLSVSSLTVLEGDATGGTYTVKLATEPTETVTVTVSGQQNTDVTLGASTLTFSDTDWASPQSVTVTARDDADDTDDSVTLTHTAAGGEYTGVSADLAVTVTDDDRGIVLSVSSLTVLEGDATGGTYTVKLATEPTETVTVTVSGQQNTDVTLGASTLTFSDTDWASPQSVTVTARDDADDTDDSVTLTHTAAGGEYTGVTADLAVTVTDDDRGIVLSVSSLTVLEGDATGGTYTVKLATEPTETVTVTVSGQQNTDVTLGASTLTFSDTDWASPQSVTVTARDDADGTDDSVTLTHTAAGGEYTGVSADLAVTVTDDDRGIVLSVSSLTVLEGDATGGTYTVALATEPTETVTVTVSGQQNTDVTLGASTLTFSDTDWASPQSVTVTARDDADDTDDSVTLTHTAAGGEYTGVSADLAVTVTDDDRGIVLSVSSLTVLEGDATGGTYTVKLATEPTETVTVTVSGQQNTDVTLSASTLTFSDTDWASPQSVTVTARDDADDTDDSVTLTHTAAGGEYTGVSADLAVTVTDDDRGIVLSVSSLTVLEGDATGGTYTVALATEPTETVTVTVSGQQNTDVTLGASTLTFSDTDWASPQSVTVTARDDADGTDDSVTLTHTAAGGEYTGVSADLAVTVTDDDRGIVLSVSSLTVLEGDATGGTYTVALATEPSETVTVTVSGQQNTDVTLGASTLTFSDTDWASPQSVTVTARDDADDTDDSVTLTHTAAGGEYTGVTADLAVTVTDDDRGIVLSVSSLTVLEGDATGGTYTVKLATEPTETVTVTVSGQQNTDVTLGASTLTFSDTDWASPQSVTVTARDDADDTDDSVTLTHTAAGGEYTGVSADLAVTVTDDDRGIVLSVSSLTVLEGDATGGTYTVKLATEPTETVTVTVSGQQNTDVTLGASTLTFSDTDWASPQSVTVTARDDADDTDDSVTLTHTAAGGEYTGVTADLAVTVTDDDRAIVLSVSSLTVLEGDATGGTYTVKLATEPSETVTVTVSGHQNTDVTLGASTLTFSDTDWASPQTVTVTAREDADDTDDTVTLVHAAQGGDYTGVTADLAVTVTDDDRAIVLSVSSLTVLEGDATGGAYTVKLATEPTETVTVTVSGQQNTDVTLGGLTANTLTFTDTDWASPQTVTVTAADDADDTDDSVTLTHTAAGGEYTGVSADLAVTVTDDDRGIVLSVSSLTVLEGDATGGTYTVALATEPSETVTVTVSGQQNTDVTLGGLTANTLTFTDTDWASPQTVTVTAADDADDTDDSVTLVHAAQGGDYTGVTADLAVTVADDDRAIVLSVSSLGVVEGDATGGAYTVKLATEPTETVTVTVSGQAGTDVTLSASTLMFTTSDWGSPQSVTVTAREDADDTDDTVTLVHAAQGGEYTGVTADLAVTVADDDRAIVLSVSSLGVVEGDATGGAYTVKLATEPTETVTVTVSGQAGTDVTLSASTLMFTTSDWGSPQSVTVTAREDADDTDDSVTLVHAAQGGDYTGVTADLAVTVIDNDVPEEMPVTMANTEEPEGEVVSLARVPDGTVIPDNSTVFEGGTVLDGSTFLEGERMWFRILLSAADDGPAPGGTDVEVSFTKVEVSFFWQPNSPLVRTLGLLSRAVYGLLRGTDVWDTNIDTQDNAVGNPASTVTVRITGCEPDSCVIGTPSQITLTIADDDGGPAAAPPARPVRPEVLCPDRGASFQDTGIKVRWRAPEFEGGAPIEGYGVRYRRWNDLEGEESGWGEWQPWPHNGISTSTDIVGLDTDTSYGVQVRAVNANGAGEWSREGTGRTGEPDYVCEFLAE